jgi:TIR domain/Pentapeptide repeats (8 copies)
VEEAASGRKAAPYQGGSHRGEPQRGSLGAAHLNGADLSRADLSLADLGGADFRGADLRGADLTLAKFNGANLSGVKLSRADLRRANLYEANLNAANLSGARLFGADLFGADLRGADLRGANLYEANLSGANLRETDFSEAILARTVFGGVDLSTAKGLETVDHRGPSTVGVDTIYRSQGKIPEVFLRGAGLPDEFIAYIGSLVGRPIQFYSCFISYSSKDQEFADRLYEGLQGKGVRCWFAPHDVKGGEKLHEQIDAAIRLHDKLLLILSEHSMNSEWVKTEIAKARKREMKEGKRVLFPVRLVGFEALRDWECFDADTRKDSAHEIREYFIPDFSNWKDHDSFQKGFERLLKDLKSPDAGAKSVAPAKD